VSLDSDLGQGERVLGRMTRATERALIAAYSRALKGLRAILAGYHERYGVGGILDWNTMAKYRRLASLEKEVAAQLKALGGDVGRLTTGGSSDAYSESYLRTAYALEREAQAKLGWTLLNPATIAASVQNPISGMKLSERLAGNRVAIVAKIRAELTQGLIRGEGYGDMARRIKAALDGDAAKAIRVAQTEAHRVMQEGRLASMRHAEAKGVRQQKTWVATLDELTREDHQALDGQTVPVDGYFEIRGMKAKAPGGFGIAAMDISCRCGIRSSIEGYEPQVRRARGEGVIPYQTYPEWKAGRGQVSPYQGPEPQMGAPGGAAQTSK
jgi:SPP1 gp7 family putative phage head morphogenesis protein